MKRTKILKATEFGGILRSIADNTHIVEIVDENIKTELCSPIFESNAQPVTDKIDNAIIALPANLDENVVNVDSLTDTITNHVDHLNVEGDVGFSVGHFFAGDYTSGESVWNRESLCVSLYGAISDRKTTLYIANRIYLKHKLPSILIVGETSSIELTKNGAIITSITEKHVKRLYEN